MHLKLKIPFILLLLVPLQGFTQEGKWFKGRVLKARNNKPLSGANIVNLTQVTGSISNAEGYFAIHALPGDTLSISFLGYQTLKFVVDSSAFNKIHTFKLYEKPIFLNEIVISGFELTGILPVDLALIPVQPPPEINPHLELLFGEPKQDFYSRQVDNMRKISDPVGMLYNIFSAHGKDMRKLKKLKEDNNITSMLAKRFDRQIIADLLNIPPEKVYRILELCQYDENFLKNASDLQILEALKSCYEKHRILLEKQEQ